jgi:hypothetical protein
MTDKPTSIEGYRQFKKGEGAPSGPTLPGRKRAAPSADGDRTGQAPADNTAAAPEGTVILTGKATDVRAGDMIRMADHRSMNLRWQLVDQSYTTHAGQSRLGFTRGDGSDGVLVMDRNDVGETQSIQVARRMPIRRATLRDRIAAWRPLGWLA